MNAFKGIFTPKRPEEIELDDTSFRRRTIAVLILLVIGIGAIGTGLWQGLSKDSGYTVIEAPAGADSFQDEIRLLYDVSTEAPTADYRAAATAYTEANRRAYRVFDAYRTYSAEDLPYGANLAAINASPNEDIQIDPWLYDAMTKMEGEYVRDGGEPARLLYMAPIYESYDSLFHCMEDEETESFDPEVNADLASWMEETLSYINDSRHIRLEFPGENTVRLVVSEEYQTFAEENGIGAYIDFWLLKNAFAMDAIADAMAEAGCTHAALTSADGISRTIDERGVSMTLELSDRAVEYTSPSSAAVLKDEPAADSYDDRFYVRKDGRVITPYIDPKDGKSKASYKEIALLGDVPASELAYHGLMVQLGYRSPDAADGIEVMVSAP